MNNRLSYQDLRQAELQSKFSDFDFSQILKQVSNNDYWRGKEALWTVISGACNEAAKEYFIKQSSYIQNLVDVDTCEIHALKSMAESIGASALTDFILENYPTRVTTLLNLFSIPKHILLSPDGILNFESVTPVVGNIDYRNTFIDAAGISAYSCADEGTLQKYYYTLIADMYDSIEHLKTLLIVNLLPYSETEHYKGILTDIFEKTTAGEDYIKWWDDSNLDELSSTDEIDVYYFSAIRKTRASFKLKKSGAINSLSNILTLADIIYSCKEFGKLANGKKYCVTPAPIIEVENSHFNRFRGIYRITYRIW
jgi:hypothetical protein